MQIEEAWKCEAWWVGDRREQGVLGKHKFLWGDARQQSEKIGTLKRAFKCLSQFFLAGTQHKTLTT